METPKKLMQELSDLTRNLDVLARDIRESNKVNSQSQKILAKNLEISDKRKTETPSTDNQNKNFLENLGKTIKASLPDASKIVGNSEGIGKKPGQRGQITKDLIGAVVGKFPNIPKMASGGKVNRPGVALVGEKGPEVVELQKGDSVNPLDKMSQLMKMEDEDSKSKKTQPGKGSSEIVSGTPKLGEFITNSFGVKVPAVEINKAREEYKKEYADEIAQDPNFLEEEVKSFIEGYRETMSVSDVQKLSGLVKSKEIKNPEEETPKNKLKGTKNTESKVLKSKVGKSENEKSNLQKSAMSFGEKIKGSLKDAYENSAIGKTVAGAKSLSKEYKEYTKGKSEMKKESLILKDQSKAKPEMTKPQEETKKEPGSKPDRASAPARQDSPSTDKSKTSPPSTAGTASADKGKETPITAQDIQDIKGLLAAMNATLNGPLLLKDNKPFRPKSNMLE
jgi:hypothetical protein